MILKICNALNCDIANIRKFER
ncbi:MAG: hypothetical protein LBS74_07605 [Oscillospiraceae bacterium]|nr:hypothetical protein [Oscillospiraceae bacterium]